MKRLIAILGAVALAAALSYPVSALEWRGHGPLLVTVESNATTLKPYVDAAMAAWNESSEIDMVYGPRPKGGKPFIQVNEGDFGPTGIGSTILSNERGFIAGATVKLNIWYVVSPEVWAYAACHELGHALGLNHDDQPGDDHRGCMNVTYQGRPLPSPYDLDLLEAMY